MKKKFILLGVILSYFFIQTAALAQEVETGCAAVYGDSQRDHASHQKIVNAIIKTKPEVVFHCGDLVEDGLNPDNWRMFNAITHNLLKTAEFYPALGNHDMDSPLFFQNFPKIGNKRWYSIDKKGIHFVILDSCLGLSEDSPQYEWLISDLESVRRDIKFIIALFHHPIFSTGTHREDDKKIGPLLLPLFEKYGVDLVFSGHNHAYERFYYKNIYFIVTGGGGGGLQTQKTDSPYLQLYARRHHFCQVCVSGNTLSVKAFDSKLKVIDQFEIKKKQGEENGDVKD